MSNDLEKLLERLAQLLPPAPPPTDWKASIAFRWRKSAGLNARGWLQPVRHVTAGIVFLLGFGIILVTTHGLAHLVVGSLLGMRFTHWFLGSWRQPQPGVKLDYAIYLRTPASSRAWMHASGAIVTKLMPIAFLGAALAADLPTWVPWVLAVVAIAAIATDIFWSTNSSDWKKFRREMALAHPPS